MLILPVLVNGFRAHIQGSPPLIQINKRGVSAARFQLRKFHQHCLPIDLHHCAWIAIDLPASKHPEKG